MHCFVCITMHAPCRMHCQCMHRYVCTMSYALSMYASLCMHHVVCIVNVCITMHAPCRMHCQCMHRYACTMSYALSMYASLCMHHVVCIVLYASLRMHCVMYCFVCISTYARTTTIHESKSWATTNDENLWSSGRSNNLVNCSPLSIFKRLKMK